MGEFHIISEGYGPDAESADVLTDGRKIQGGEWQCGDGHGVVGCEGIVPDIAGVSETMLWSLHNRASEAKRADSVLTDPASIRIHDAMDYDFTYHFGDPLGSLAERAAEIDGALRIWLERHPDGIVVSLGEGLETQGRRVDNGRLRWLSVDLPAAIRLRECFLAPDRRFRHIAASALDPVWMEAVDPSSGVFIVAQGLLMYLEPEGVRELFIRIADRFPGAEIVFDTVPRWFSHLTLWGLNQTEHYRLPSMPWGINRNEIEPTLHRWHRHVSSIAFLCYRPPRGPTRVLAELISQVPIARQGVPSLVHVTIEGAPSQSHMLSSPSATEDPSELGPEERSLRLRAPPAFRKPRMNSNIDDTSTADTMSDLLTVATQNAMRGSDIVVATTQVIAKRVGLGLAAAFNPLRADHVEFARMVPEKVETFSAAGMILLKESGQANRQLIRLASDQAMTTARATIEMTGCSSPVALAEAQGRFARAWFDRVTSSFITMGLLALTTQAAAMAPIRQTVVANAERLGR
jgi:O-methyltransferase involved in polyketide biosynthesis